MSLSYREADLNKRLGARPRFVWFLFMATLAFATAADASDYSRIEKLDTVDIKKLWHMREVSILNSSTDLRMKYYTYSGPLRSHYSDEYKPAMLIMIGGRRDTDPIAILISTKGAARFSKVNIYGPQEEFLFMIRIAEKKQCEGCDKAEFFLREIDGFLFVNDQKLGEL